MLLLLLLLADPFTQCRKVPAGEKIKVTLKPESTVDDLVGWASTMSCKKILLPQALQQRKVTLIAPTPVSAEEGYRLFLSALNSVGLTVIPAGDALSVVETTRAKEGAPVATSDPPPDERYVTQLVHVDHVMPSELLPILDKLRTHDAQLSAYDPSGTLILMDTAANVRRMLEVVQALDVAGADEKPWILPLRSPAQAMAERIQQVFGPLTAPGAKAAPSAVPHGEPGPSRIVVDERTNTLILVASQAVYERVRDLVNRLEAVKDATAEEEDGWVHRVALSHANAEELAPTLAAIAGVQVAQTAPRKPAAGNPAPTPGPSPAPMAAPTSLAPFDGEVRVVPERATNSLIVLGSRRDFLTLRGLIRELDVERRQVLIEATILEVSLDRLRDVSLSFHGGQADGSGNVMFGGSNAGTTLGALTQNGQSALLGDVTQGLAFGVLGHSLDIIPGMSVPSFGVFLKALATSSDVHVLSTPQLLTMDNEPASIVVGQNLPFPTQVPLPTSTATGSTTLFSGTLSVDHKDVALSLKITPQINEGGQVRLKVEQEVSDVLAANYNGLGPATSKRRLETTVTVDDEQPIVLGGLRTERTETTESKVPILGDIPILGWFFKSQQKHVARANLLMILVPHVIHDRSDLRRLYERKEQERQELLERWAAFQNARETRARIDYGRRRGLLQDMNRCAREMDDEAALRSSVRRQLPRSSRPEARAAAGAL